MDSSTTTPSIDAFAIAEHLRTIAQVLDGIEYVSIDDVSSTETTLAALAVDDASLRLFLDKLGWRHVFRSSLYALGTEGVLDLLRELGVELPDEVDSDAVEQWLDANGVSELNDIPTLIAAVVSYDEDAVIQELRDQGTEIITSADDVVSYLTEARDNIGQALRELGQ